MLRLLRARVLTCVTSAWRACVFMCRSVVVACKVFIRVFVWRFYPACFAFVPRTLASETPRGFFLTNESGSGGWFAAPCCRCIPPLPGDGGRWHTHASEVGAACAMCSSGDIRGTSPDFSCGHGSYDGFLQCCCLRLRTSRTAVTLFSLCFRFL